MIPITSFAKSDIGLKRESNEDAFVVDEALHLYAVADGMGGMLDGEVASTRALSALRRSLAEQQPTLEMLAARGDPDSRLELERGMQRAFLEACADVHALATRDARKSHMGTTLIAVLAVGDKAVIGHVGDSRIYLFRQNQMHLLTEDHTLGMEQVRRGALTEEQVRTMPTRNILLRAIGLQPEVAVDTLLTDLYPGDTFLLCTDGLYGALRPHELHKALAHEEISQVPADLIALANARGGKDNSTAMVLAVGDDAQSRIDVHAQVEVLRGIPLFEALSYKDGLELLSISRTTTVKEGEAILREGSPGAEMFAIVSGRVRVSKAGQPIAELRDGGYFGEMVLFDHSPRSATVTALEECTLIALERDGLLKLMQRNVELANRFLWAFGRVMATRLRTMNATVAAVKSQQ